MFEFIRIAAVAVAKAALSVHAKVFTVPAPCNSNDVICNMYGVAEADYWNKYTGFNAQPLTSINTIYQQMPENALAIMGAAATCALLYKSRNRLPGYQAFKNAATAVVNAISENVESNHEYRSFLEY